MILVILQFKIGRSGGNRIHLMPSSQTMWLTFCPHSELNWRLVKKTRR